MSDAIFPSFPGLSPSIGKKPTWSTSIQKTVSGRELRVANYSRPIWTITLSFEVLRQGALGEIEALIGFFNNRRGALDTFLFSDPTDNRASMQSFGTGDGFNDTFTLLHGIGGFSEPVGAPDGDAVIYVNGVPETGCSITGNRVQFNEPPYFGAALSWSGHFFYRVRFADDELDTEQFLYKLWQSKSVELVSVK